MSFPRKRESRATATSLALDPRFRGGDSPREMRKQQAFYLILAPMRLGGGRGDKRVASSRGETPTLILPHCVWTGDMGDRCSGTWVTLVQPSQVEQGGTRCPGR